jgi:hypothetical protein
MEDCNRTKRKIYCVASIVLCCLLSTSVFAQATGTITGYVYEADSRNPLAFANVILLGTTFGGMTFTDGSFNIAGIPPGTYTIKAMMMGYKPVEKEITVISLQTVELKFPMEVTIVKKTRIIEVFASRPLIDVTTARPDKGENEKEVLDRPIDDISDVVALETGALKVNGRLYVQGCRDDEVQYQIDGVPVNDPIVGGTGIQIGLLTQGGYEFISGGMDAEYGNAQAAVVNYATKEGGEVFSGEIRYLTDDFGRADKTYTNYDRLSIGFGGPTWWRNLRYYVSGEAIFTDTETNTIEPRAETKITSWLKYRPRLRHNYNLQTKLSLIRSTFKLTTEGIVSRAKSDIYLHNWNVKGYVQKIYYFQRLQKIMGEEAYSFAGITRINHGTWVNNPQSLNPRRVKVLEPVRNPETGLSEVIEYNNFRAVDFGEITVLWDELLVAPDGSGFIGNKSWILFEGFQYPYSKFSNFHEDTSYVFFNSATRTPEYKDNNLQLKLSFNHNISEKVLYSIKLSRLQRNTLRTVNGKSPAEFTSAGLPVTLPNGTYLEGGITTANWYTDPDHPYFVTAYDFPSYAKNKVVQYLLKSDLTSEQLPGHRLKTGIQLIFNDLGQDERAFPAQARRDGATGMIQQGRSVNNFRNVNTEGACYAQDKWEYEGMVMSAGFRFDFFSTGNNDKILIQSADIDTQVEKYKYTWSPRLGIAFPITDRDKFFFHYGRSTQWPSRAYLFRVQDPIGFAGTMGNPNLGPKLNVSYHAGISHQFTENIAANFVVFNRDIYGLISSALVTDDSTGIQSLRFVNKTYASSRGLEVSLEKRLSHHIGCDIAYTFSFADGVASDADFGRTAEGLTHLPTEELPLNWDQRHMLNVTLTVAEGNRWGATAVYQYGSGLPWTPFDRFARLQDPMWENSERLPSTHILSLQGRKKFSIYGRELTLFFEGKNLLDEDILPPEGTAPMANPNMIGARMDGGSYLTETGRYGGAYLKDIDDDGIDDFIPVNDPTIWDTHRLWRIGFGFEF